MSFFKRFSVVTALFVIGSLSVGASVGAVSSGGIGGRPANPDTDNPRTQSIFIFTADKGEMKKDVILVSNNDDQKRTIELYATDGIVTNTGSYTCSQQAEAKREMGSWLAIDKRVVTLDPGKTEEVGFTLTLPSTANVGEHNGCIVFQVQDDSGETTGNVRILTRQAVRVVATVPGDLHRSVDIQSFVVTDKNGRQTFDLSLKNNGNVSADVDAKVYLTSIFGDVAYQNGGGYPVLADQKLDLTFTNDSKPFFGGWYYTQTQVTYDKRAGSFGVGAAANAIVKSSERQLVFLVPTVGGVLTILSTILAVGGAMIWYLRRRQARTNIVLYGQKYTVKAGDTIQTIADKHGISWRQLTSINNIAAPYILTAGSKIHVPVKKQANGKNVRKLTKR